MSTQQQTQSRTGGAAWRRFLRTEARILTFRDAPIARADVKPYLFYGLLVTWIAGLGRYWDHASPEWWQVAGLGSVAYVFVLAAVIWAVGLPLHLRHWRYSSVLLFLCLTSPLAWAYAIPVERFLPMDTARAANAWFLGVVAVWRVALLLRFLVRPSGLSPSMALATALLPLAGIVMVLTALNLEHATYEIMGSRVGPATPHDTSYRVVEVLSWFSFLASPVLLMTYISAVVARQKDAREHREAVRAAEAA